MNWRKWLILLTFCVSALILLPLVNTSAHEGGPHVRFVHLSLDLPAIDVYVNGQLVVKALKYKDVTEYLSLEGEDQDFAFVPAGGKLADALTEKPVSLTFAASEGRFFTVIAIGSPKDKTFELLKLPADRGGETTGTAEPHDDDHDEDATPAATQPKP